MLLCGSVSKTLAPGYRVGWVVPGRYQEVIERLKFSQTLASPTLTQMAVAEFLASGGYDRHLRRLRRTLAGRVERFRERHRHRVPRRHAGHRAAGRLRAVGRAAGRGRLARAAGARVELGIAIAPGPIFSARNRFQNFVRLSCGSLTPRTEAAMSQVAVLACRLAGRPPGAGSRAWSGESLAAGWLPCFQVDAFTGRPFAGNPAGGCPARGLAAEDG